MNKYLKKDLQRRILVCKFEKKKIILKAILSNLNLPLKLRIEAQIELSKLPRDSSIVRIRNRSLINSKPRGNLTKYGIDRITFKDWVQNGLIPGCTTYSW